MKGTRNLWLSVGFVAVLVVSSAVGFATGSLKPTLGLDLQGGLSVILSAPSGTSDTVMNQALENIRNRVDAFGVGEPQISLAGNNIEVQLPGLAPGTIQTRPKDQWCITASDGKSYGCATDQATAEKALAEITVVPEPKTVCVVDGAGKVLDQSLCFGTQAEADTARAGISVQPKASPTPSGSPTASPSATPSGSPTPAPGPYCLTDSTGKTFGCYPTQDKANAAQKGLTSKTTAHTYCLLAPATITPPTPSPTPTPSPSPGGGKATPTPSASPSPVPSPSPSAFSTLSFVYGTAGALPCAFPAKTDAQAALSALSATHQTQIYCVISSANKNLGCFLSRQDAVNQQHETGQSHLLEVIGQTARLEERVVQAVLPPTDPNYASLPLTCPTATEQKTKACSFAVLAKQEVVYVGADGQTKYKLGPVVISGGDIKKAQAVFQSATSTSLSQGWAINFSLNSSGSSAFCTATKAALNAPSPQNQIAIAVDQTIISAPTVNGEICAGSGVISGSFTETRAKDLATQLNAGALPVELTRQSVETVSPTLGSQSLHQGILAGVAGLIALFVYLLFYYRLLGVVAWLGMSIWATLAFAMVSLAGKSFGYSLSLAGIAGLVISLGVTADSYIVFFERLKDEVRNGKTPRSAVKPAFKRAFRTIVAADFVTGIAAVALYVTAVSSVRGFALTLGVATLLDLFVVYFFKRPIVFLISGNQRLVDLKGFGLTSGVAGEADPEPLPSISGAAE
ncbi:MAG: protein translocase subunit SecD [Actinomycetota bacterium]